MALDDNQNENEDVFSNEPEPESAGNGDEQSNRSFRMMVLGLGAIGALGVLLIALIFLSRQGERNQIATQNQAIQATNTAIAILSQITPTPVPTNRPAPTNTAVPGSVPAKKDLVDTVLATGNFKTLANALQTAGLVDILKSQGPFTIFAPTDDAFAQLPAGTLDALLKDPQKLADLLKRHIVPGTVKAADIAKLTSAKTLEGETVVIGAQDNTPTVGDAKVTTPDIETANGVIQGIDKVLMPPELQAALVPGSVPVRKDLVDTVLATGNFKTLANALQTAGLVDILKSQGPFTILAPTDDAFAQLPAGTLDALLKDPQKLADLLKRHIVPGTVKAADIAKLTSAKTLEGETVVIGAQDNTPTVGDAKVTTPDIETANGVIQGIDKVLMPPELQAALVPGSVPVRKDLVDTVLATGNFKTLANALQTAGLVDILKSQGPFTILAPTDDAFAQLPAGTLDALFEDPQKLADLLKRHIVPGTVKAADIAKLTSARTLEGETVAIGTQDNTPTIGGAKVTTPDIETANGVIQGIDKVLMPPELQAALVPGSVPAKKDLVDTVLATGNFKTLANALQAAGLVDILKGQGPYTIFAPTDDAFAQLPAGTLDALLKDPQKLADLLKYHIVQGAVKAADIAKQTSARTLEGGTVATGTQDNTPTIGDAKVTTPDIVTTNGVIHAIDKVLSPPGLLAGVTPQATSATTVAQAQATARPGAATPKPGVGSAAATLVPTRIPPGSTGTVVASAGITSTRPISGTTGTGAGQMPPTGASDITWVLLAVGLVAVLIVARRMRTSQG